jgi:glutaminyl-peptide cyclotransferase
MTSTGASAAATTRKRKQSKTNNTVLTNPQEQKTKSYSSKSKSKKGPNVSGAAADPIVDKNDDDMIALEQAYSESRNRNRRLPNQLCQIAMLGLGAVVVILAIAFNRYGNLDQHYATTASSIDDVNEKKNDVDSTTTATSTVDSTAKMKSRESNKHDPKKNSVHEHQEMENNDDDSGRPIAMLSKDWQLLETRPHDPTAFTQGLEVHYHHINEDNDDSDATTTLLVESTGHYGYEGGRGTFDESSLVRIWDVHNGTVIQQVQLDEKLFGEGLTRITLTTMKESDDDVINERNAVQHHDYYLLLTWREQTALLLNTTTLQVEYTFTYETHSRQGWGVAYDPFKKQIYVSDGSHMIHVWELYLDKQEQQQPPHVQDDGQSIVTSTTSTVVRYREVRRFTVSLKLKIPGRKDIVDRSELHLLNELEWDPYTQTILSNLWFENLVFRICPQTGHVLKVYDFNRLYPKEERTTTADVLNGIAIVPTSDGNQQQEWWLTGKYWPYIYKVLVDV